MTDCAQYYKCVAPKDFKPLSNVIALGLFAGWLVIMDVLASIIGGALVPGLGVVAAAFLIAGIFELCAFLSGGKLVCLKDDACTIGRVMVVHPVGSDKSGFEAMDDDYTYDITPSPHSPRETDTEIAAIDPIQGPFMLEQTATKNLSLPFEGISKTFSKLKDAADKPITTHLFHVEVKGCRVHDVCIALKISAVASGVVGVICSIPVIGWIACLIAAAIWAVLTAIAMAITWAAAHVGDPNDVRDDPEAGEIRAADGETGEGGDVILVRGDWAYDAGHNGWNEIHPIRYLHKLTNVIDPKYQGMDKASATLVAEFKKEVYDVWCEAVGKSTDPLVIANQGQPENNWHIHPLIDGCKPTNPSPDIR